MPPPPAHPTQMVSLAFDGVSEHFRHLPTAGLCRDNRSVMVAVTGAGPSRTTRATAIGAAAYKLPTVAAR
jgi:hypothetical protein